MHNFTLLVGNDINNISPGVSWEDLLKNIKTKYGIPKLENGSKPFPMLYEEISLYALKNNNAQEQELKEYIGNAVSTITENEIHKEIRELPIEHIITTNYEFSLEGQRPEHNTGLIRETTYSVFRQFQVDNKRYWHIHGDCNTPMSINLGYLHYCGQLQKMRDYVVNGPNYNSKSIHKESLIRRLKIQNKLNVQSWIDLFFTHDVHILGLTLDFVEIDLWWLLTYRAHNKYHKRSSFIENQLYYYITKDWAKKASDKIQLLQANDVEVVVIDEKDKATYYHKVIKSIKGRYKQKIILNLPTELRQLKTNKTFKAHN